jgi:hypothetical protein
VAEKYRQRYGKLSKFFFGGDHAFSEADDLQDEINQKLRRYSEDIAKKDAFLQTLFFEKLDPTEVTANEDFQKVFSHLGLEQVHSVKRALMALIACAGWVIEFATRVMKALTDCYTVLRKFLFPSKREYALLYPSRFSRSISSYLQTRVGEQIFQRKICFLGQHSEVKV